MAPSSATSVAALFSSSLLSSPATALATLSALAFGYLIAKAVYRLTLHPLSSFPGPRFLAATRLPYWWTCIQGTQMAWFRDLHKRYGPVVRFSPNDLSYIDFSETDAKGGETWQAIHGHEKGRPEFPKAAEFFQPPYNGVMSLISAEYADHRRCRRVLAPAFSDRALRAQEPLFLRHIDLLISKLRGRADGKTPVEMVRMYNFTTFDIMGDLTFGQPLGLLDQDDYSPQIKAVWDSVRVLPFIQMIEYYPLLKSVWAVLEPQVIKDMKTSSFKYSSDRVDRRLELGSHQPDIWGLVIAADDEKGMTLPEMHINSELFMMAGSETTATLLSGLTYLLLANPDKMAKVVSEIRSAFAGRDSSISIDMQSLAGLRYTNACISEALRVYPPVPIGLPRYVPEDGQTILGRAVAAGTRVHVHHFATYHSPLNFVDPDDFIPERWLGDQRYKNDRLGAVQAFSFGPRNCMGQNMALHEMRLILAAVLINFDLELCDESHGWADQRVFAVWEKKNLMCRLKPAAM